MPIVNLKALAVVLAVAMIVFIIAKPISLRFTSEEDFIRRRNIWFVLTIVAFLSPTAWLFNLTAIPLLVWGTRKDSNPVALYLMMMSLIPQTVGLGLAAIGGTKLFDLNIYRIVAIGILLPAAWRLVQSRDRSGGSTWIDVLIVAYGSLHVFQWMPYESETNTLRRAALIGIDIFLLYYVVSRTCTRSKTIVDAMAAFCVICAVYAPLAVFEALKGWLLYYEIGAIWGTPSQFPYLFRAGVLRAQVSAGHALPLGVMLAVAFGFWLYFSSQMQSNSMKVKGAIWLWAGLVATYSRGPWVMAIAIFFTFLALLPDGSGKLLKALFISALLGGTVLVSPVGNKIIDSLPFVGTIDSETVTYRQRIAARSWELIRERPLLGDPHYLLRLEDLRQGQGIIDLMNEYAVTTMGLGIVGLFLLFGPFLICMGKVYRRAKGLSAGNTESALLGATLFACMFGILLVLATGGMGASLERLFWIFLGMATGYSQLSQTQQSVRRDGARGRSGVASDQLSGGVR